MALLYPRNKELMTSPHFLNFEPKPLSHPDPALGFVALYLVKWTTSHALHTHTLPSKASSQDQALLQLLLIPLYIDIYVT